MTTKEFIKTFGDFVNTFSRHDQKELEDALTREHRTLQQSMFGILLQMLLVYASDDYATDGRNEHSKKMAKKLIKGYAEVLFEEEFERLKTSIADEDYAREKPTEHKEAFLRNPAMYLGVPCI